MSPYDEKSDQELYRLDEESLKSDAASISVDVEGAKVKVSNEVEDLGVIFSQTTVSDETPETVVIKFGDSEMQDLSGNSSADIVITASKDLVVE
jgi:hypothetical protein